MGWEGRKGGRLLDAVGAGGRTVSARQGWSEGIGGEFLGLSGGSFGAVLGELGWECAGKERGRAWKGVT